jgi:plasmid stabilization system protein ParE
MIYKIVVTREAEDGLRDAYRFIRRDSREAASRWAKGARRSIRSLSRFPERCPVSSETREFDIPVRELLYGSGNRGTFRVLFAIIERTVFVLHFRHGSMEPLLTEGQGESSG